jgi:spermidine synthase
MRLSLTIPPPVLTITTTGFVATVAQIIILRELLVFFYGNELSAGLIFAGWVLWSGLGSGVAGRWAIKISAHTILLRLILIYLAAMLPLSVLFIRATRIIWSLPAGELPTIGKMLLISFAVTGLLCPLAGALFGICWAMHRKEGENRPLRIYLGEALGSAAGGLVFYFVFLPYGSVFTTIWITSGIALLVSWCLFQPWGSRSNMGFGHLLWIVVSLMIVSGAVLESGLNNTSRRWQWGSDISAVYDTAYHNIALLKKEGQVSVFSNGLWSFSEPDRLSAEHGVHLALLQHPDPKTILLMGGGIAGQLEELFKHQSVQGIDYVEPDPDFIPLVKTHLSSATNTSLQHRRVRLLSQDPSIFMRRSQVRYDVILMNMGDPINVQMNRFYTSEFFALVKQRLHPGGIFSFAVSGGESILGPTQARFLGSIKKTLLQVFPKTLIYPGDQVRFFATYKSGVLLSDFTVLRNRIAERNLKLIYVRESTLQDTLSPLRLGYFESILEGTKGVSVNRDFFPICYFHNLMMWAIQWHDGLQKFLSFLANLKLRWLWIGLTVAGAIIAGIFWTGRHKFRTAIAGSIFVSGAIEMILQVVLLVSFQIMVGFVYRQLALIIAFFMTGLAVGAGLISWRYTPQPKFNVTRRLFIRVQILVCMLPLGLTLFFLLAHRPILDFLSPAAIGWLFSGFSLMIGIIGGVHFAMATIVMAGTGVALEKIGGGFYALDLIGAAAGVLVASLFMIPLCGILNMLFFLSAIAVISLLTLLRSP